MDKNKRNPEFIMKMGFVVIGLILVLVSIIASYVWDLIFNPENFNIVKWANRAVFNNSIKIATMVLGFIGVAELLKSFKNGRYQKRVESFNEEVNQLYETNRFASFDEFLIWLTEKELKEKKVKHLVIHGAKTDEAMLIVEFAKIDDIPTITGIKQVEVEKGFWKWKRKVTVIEKPLGHEGEDIVRELKDGSMALIPAVKDVLAPYIEDVLDGSITVKCEDSSYYITIGRSDNSNLSSVERAKATERERVKSLVKTFISAFITGVIYTTMFALLVTEQNEGVGTSEAIWNLLLRLGSATLGVILGGFAGISDVNYLYKVLGEKMTVLIKNRRYTENGDFVAKSFEELKKERINKYLSENRHEKQVEEEKVDEELPMEENATLFATQNEQENLAK